MDDVRNEELLCIFAAAALAGLMANPTNGGDKMKNAQEAWATAHAMLVTRPTEEKCS